MPSTGRALGASPAETVSPRHKANPCDLGPTRRLPPFSAPLRRGQNVLVNRGSKLAKKASIFGLLMLLSRPWRGALTRTIAQRPARRRPAIARAHSVPERSRAEEDRYAPPRLQRGERCSYVCQGGSGADSNLSGDGWRGWLFLCSGGSAGLRTRQGWAARVEGKLLLGHAQQGWQRPGTAGSSLAGQGGNGSRIAGQAVPG